MLKIEKEVKMYKNNKGISDVVSTVLIILLVVAAVAIVGAIIINVVSKGGSSVNQAVACQGLSLVPTSCKNTTATNFIGVLQLNALPSGIASVSGINVIFVKADGSTDVAAGSPATLSTIGTTSSVTNTNGPFAKVQAGATLTLSDGTTAQCAPKPSEEVLCTS